MPYEAPKKWCRHCGRQMVDTWTGYYQEHDGEREMELRCPDPDCAMKRIAVLARFV